MFHVVNHISESFLQRLILSVNGVNVGSAYQTGFHKWFRCITTVMLEKIPIGFHYGPPLTIRGLGLSQYRAKEYIEGTQYISYKGFHFRGTKEKMHRLSLPHYNREGTFGMSFSSLMRTPYIIIRVQPQIISDVPLTTSTDNLHKLGYHSEGPVSLC